MAHGPTVKDPQESDRRRSDRVFIPVPLVVSGEGADGKAFEEETHTLRVNSTGALIALGAGVRVGQNITVLNRRTDRAQPCLVAYVGAAGPRKPEVGVEFTSAAPGFWESA